MCARPGEIGPKDMEKEQCVTFGGTPARRSPWPWRVLGERREGLLDHIHDNLYAMALKNREDTLDIQSPEEAKAIVRGRAASFSWSMVRQSGV